ncbi:restriction endonuclease subunit S [Lawsonibacter faecis]|jgi:restriction modification system DNA specificity domain protein|uniref:Restriction endonuclease subunit S n=1 Tax=Lawsonibacter faecis TaxID=2763052 RepID=A0A8J6JL17_9FIRM|nr:MULTISPECIES: restriction endonuclease subunit S [Oscillospiraceae]KAB4835532.1 hypothetical protein GAG88_27385 [Bacteroides thetaiotaomicron]MTQ95347.1 hypothetical protein [Pseudoflavonifractor sp. BIOML-A16]MTR07078.1 hypothetical protein [Pseudoflavonifractor sp. BIOML-A15]MTR32359.1 hypothetical protein [Pseudoflavonifractor sp. BIOML-A14]MTR72711.1 hypothetical protein [Pseudoflavonifractor sp. BIOML-A18]MTS64391.1 hypothetical protein [Pseudoflavonifractor sp. BIOML-A5]MTS70105.1 
MAGKRKKESGLTLEERLKRALVPEEEQPYHVPENWVWTRLDEINHFFSQTLNPATRPEQIFELYSVPSCENNFPEIVLGSEIGSSKQYVLKNDILLCKINPRINRVWIVTGHTDHSYLASSEWIVVRTTRCNPRYLLWLFQGPYFREQMLSNVSGVGGSLMRAQPKWVNRYMLPIPPGQEQERIVDRIESLFAKLDEAKEKAQAAVDGFETRKSAILQKAFTSMLTKSWREKHTATTWVKVRLETIAALQTGLMKGKHYDTATVQRPYLRVANVQDGFLDLGEIKMIEVEETKVNRYMLQTNDVLFTEGGDFDKLGRGTVWKGEIKNCLHQNHIFAVRPQKDRLDPYFLSYQAGSRYGKQYFLSCSKQTTNLASINSKQLNSFPVLLPCISEQQEIVRILDDLLAKEQKAKEAAAAVLERIDLIKKSILARAFRGELGTNDPSEESAVELLKQCLAEGEVVP